jgi:hypothetical protein
MRKVSFVLAVLLAAVSAAVGAQEPEESNGGIGLTAGLELGFGNVADEAVFSITPNIVYEQSFDALDVFGELDYTAVFDDPAAHELYLEAELGYNFQLAEGSVFSFIVNNQNMFFLSPALEEGATHLGVVEPSVKYTQSFGCGDLVGQAGFPFDYLSGVTDETAAGMYVKAGWASAFGLGLELTGNVDLHPEAGFAGYGLLLSYEQGLFYGEVEFGADKEFKSLEVFPEIDISLGAWTVIARMELYKIDGLDDWVVMPFIGAGYSF